MFVRIFLVLGIGFLTFGPNPSVAVRKLAKHTVIKNFECQSNPKLVTDVTCNHTFLDDYTVNLTIQFRLRKPIGMILTKFKTLRFEFGAYKQYGMPITLDFCQISGGASHPLIDIMFPIFRTGVGASLRPCPYSGDFSLANFTVPPQPLSSMAPQGQKYRTELVFLRGKHLPFLTLIIFDEAQII